ALEGLGIEEGLLYRMQPAVPRETLDGGDLVPGGAEGRHETGMERLAVQPYGAGAAVAGIAALLDAEPAKVAQAGPEALARARLGREQLPVHRVAHASVPLPDNSARICSAK